MSGADQMFNNQVNPATLTPAQLQQWQQWQQQYQQWQLQYGQQYEQSLRAMQGGSAGAPPLPQSGNPPLPVAPVPAAAPVNPPLPQSAPPEELSEAEKNFDVQFKQWEQQYEDWKKQNANHPDKTQYREYEKKWETWREQLLERREEMKKKRLGSRMPPTPKEDPPLPSTAPAPALPPADPYNSEPLVFKPKPDHFAKEGPKPPKPPAEKSQTQLHQLGQNWGNFPPAMPHEQAAMIRQQIEIMCSNIPPSMSLDQRHMIMHQMQMQACNFSFNMPAEQKHMILNQMMMNFVNFGPGPNPGMNPMVNNDKGFKAEPDEDYNQPAFSTDMPLMKNNRNRRNRSPDRRPNDRFPEMQGMGPGPFGMDSNFRGNFGMGPNFMGGGMGRGNFNGPWGPGNFNGPMGPGKFMDGPRGGNFNDGPRGGFGMDDFGGDVDERSRSPGGRRHNDRGGRGRRNRRGGERSMDPWDDPPNDRGGHRGPAGFGDFSDRDRPWGGNGMDGPPPPPPGRNGAPIRGLMDQPIAAKPPIEDIPGGNSNERLGGDKPGFNANNKNLNKKSEAPWAKYEIDEYSEDPFADEDANQGSNSFGDARKGPAGDNFKPGPPNRNFPDRDSGRSQTGDEDFRGPNNFRNNRNLNDPARGPPFGSKDEDFRDSRPFGPNSGGPGRFDQDFRGPGQPERNFRDGQNFSGPRGGPWMDNNRGPPGPNNFGGRDGIFGPGGRFPGPQGGGDFPPSGPNDHDRGGNSIFGANDSKNHQSGLPGLDLVSEKDEPPMTTFEDLKLKTNSDPVQLSGFVGNILAKLGVSGAEANSKAMEVTKILLGDKPKSPKLEASNEKKENESSDWKPAVHDYANKPSLTRREQEVRELAFQVRDYSHGEFKAQTYDYGHGGGAAGGNTDYGPKKFDYSHGSGTKNKFDYGHGGDSHAVDYGHGSDAGGAKKQFDYGHGGSVAAPKSFDYGHGGRSQSPSSNRNRPRDRSRDRSPSPYRNKSRNDRSPDRRWEPRRDRGRDRRDRSPFRDRDLGRDRDFGRGRDRRDRSPLQSGSPRRSPSPRRNRDEPKVVKAKTEVGAGTTGPSVAGNKEAVGAGVLLEDLIFPPGRHTRPHRMAFIMRGVSGSGKSFVTKLIKDKESESGGSAPRILSMDDYFMADVEVEETDEATGQKTMKKVMKYEYDADMEEVYEAALLKAFKKTVSDGFFYFVIVDAVNKDLKQVEDMWSFAKQKGFQVYICEMDNDAAVCAKRNIHGRTETDIQEQEKGWQSCPGHYLRLDVRSLLQSEAIEDVEMEDVEDSSQPASEENSQEGRTKEDEDEPAFNYFLMSKWEDDDISGQILDQLDGVDGLKKKRPASMEAFLSTEHFEDRRPIEPGKKRVRWADLEERQQQEKMRAIGFVVGQTDWKRMMDPTSGESALTRTKYI